jgi:sugar lactone lactonase YvrE
VCVFDRHGTLVDIIEVPTGTSPVIGLLGELFEEDHGLYVVDQADNVAPNGRLLKINPRTHAVTLLAAGFSFPNAIAQDRHRNLYVSDSLTGQIARVAPDGSSNTVWIDSPPTRETTGFSEFRCGGTAAPAPSRSLPTARPSIVS